MTTSKSTQLTALKRIVIKLGGSMLEGLNENFFTNFKKLQAAGNEIVIVHGGGPAINKALATNGVTTTSINGIRVTSAEAIGIVQSTLVGQVNPALVHQLNKSGIQAIGLSGYDSQLLQCTILDEATYGFVGEIQQVNTSLIETLLKAWNHSSHFKYWLHSGRKSTEHQCGYCSKRSRFGNKSGKSATRYRHTRY